MGDLILALYFWGLALLVTVISLPWTALGMLIFPLFDRHRKLILLNHRAWCNTMAWAYPKWKYAHHGREKIVKGRHYVIMSNHQSFADILLLFFLPGYFRWVSKRTIFLVPLFGWQFWLGGHLSITRGSEKSRARFMARAEKTLRERLSILIFPEGTRSRTGEIGPFKPGGFLLAVRTGTPILPVVISGSRDALPKHSWIPRTRTYPVVRVLDPIETKGRTEADVEALMAEVREALLKAKPENDAENARLLAAWENKSNGRSAA